MNEWRNQVLLHMHLNEWHQQRFATYADQEPAISNIVYNMLLIFGNSYQKISNLHYWAISNVLKDQKLLQTADGRLAGFHHTVKHECVRMFFFAQSARLHLRSASSIWRKKTPSRNIIGSNALHVQKKFSTIKWNRFSRIFLNLLTH